MALEERVFQSAFQNRLRNGQIRRPSFGGVVIEPTQVWKLLGKGIIEIDDISGRLVS